MDTQPATPQALSPETKTCDRDHCTAPAVFSYSFDWGESGVCCATHGQVLQQIARQIKRSVTLSPLVPAGPAPLTRDERTQLVAARLVIEQELEEAKARGLELYRVNQQLHGETKLAQARAAEAHAQMTDAQGIVAGLRAELAKRDVEHAELVGELEHLRALATFADVPPDPDPTVVEGDH